ncbi:hypothetical protein Ciccas_000227 [Cichlidogyrus casuarinus]|uniref:Arrestin C-terminal-like domain-containing protein n=1 Tax=Cichlidogyrus casuarinus TaxID=1844966 RepID=A0ABD2QNK9_9PLAT
MSVKYNVYKKQSPNGKLIAYISRRDIMDDLETVDSVDGVITLDPSYVKERKVFARIMCSFRYGQEDLDNIMNGVVFKKEFYITTDQIYPMVKKAAPNTIIQDRLLERFGQDAFPFRFETPHDIPASVFLQNAPGDSNQQPCGIEYHLLIFLGDSPSSEPQKQSCVSIQLRRLTIAVPGPLTKPYTKEMRKVFHIHSGQLKIEVTLPKEIFFHGELIPLSVVIDNVSSNTVRRIKFQIIQHTEVTIFRPFTQNLVILSDESEDGFPIEAGKSGWCHTYKIKPSMQDCRSMTGVALDGKSKHQDTNLATSTLIKDFRKKDAMGIIVQYLIKVKVVTGFGGRDIEMDIPFILTHPRTDQMKADLGDEMVIERFKRAKVLLSSSVDKAENL